MFASPVEGAKISQLHNGNGNMMMDSNNSRAILILIDFLTKSISLSSIWPFFVTCWRAFQPDRINHRSQ